MSRTKWAGVLTLNHQQNENSPTIDSTYNFLETPHEMETFQNATKTVRMTELFLRACAEVLSDVLDSRIIPDNCFGCNRTDEAFDHLCQKPPHIKIFHSMKKALPFVSEKRTDVLWHMTKLFKQSPFRHSELEAVDMLEFLSGYYNDCNDDPFKQLLWDTAWFKRLEFLAIFFVRENRGWINKEPTEIYLRQMVYYAGPDGRLMKNHMGDKKKLIEVLSSSNSTGADNA